MIDLHVVGRLRGLHGFRATSLEHEGFTPKQSAFLLLVLEHSGVFVERQYCAFAGVTHGQKTHDFLRRLTGSGLAREVRPGALHRGRLYHVHHKRLYATIGEPDNRNRRTAPIGALAARLMLLDLVLDDPSRLWLGTSRDKRRYFSEVDTQRRLEDVELPHLRYGTGRERVLRLFPASFPIGAARCRGTRRCRQSRAARQVAEKRGAGGVRAAEAAVLLAPRADRRCIAAPSAGQFSK